MIRSVKRNTMQFTSSKHRNRYRRSERFRGSVPGAEFLHVTRPSRYWGREPDRVSAEPHQRGARNASRDASDVIARSPRNTFHHFAEHAVLIRGSSPREHERGGQRNEHENVDDGGGQTQRPGERSPLHHDPRHERIARARFATTSTARKPPCSVLDDAVPSAGLRRGCRNSG